MDELSRLIDILEAEKKLPTMWMRPNNSDDREFWLFYRNETGRLECLGKHPNPNLPLTHAP
jgi:hypothetical protein